MMRGAKVGPYNRRVEAMPRVLVSGRFSDNLTPLEECAAPELDSLPADIQHPIRQNYWQMLGAASPAERAAADSWVAPLVADLIDADVHQAFDVEEIERKARNCARVCFYITDVEAMEAFCHERGINPPTKNSASTRRGRLLRARCHRWWRRALDKLYGRRAENGIRRAGTIRRGNQLYASNLAVSQRRFKKRLIDRWVKERIVRSDSGIQLNLWDVRERSQANPALRRAELMTRLRGFEEVAKAAEHVAEFVTLTTPSAYHRMLETGHPNPRYENFTVRDGQQWLCKQWARVRAKLKRLSILVYGFRIAEPHHDATPHWHMVLFTLPHHLDTLRTVLAGQWLSDRGDDPGAQNHRIKFKSITEHKGTAAGYLAKYVAKNIDGFEVGQDHETENTPASTSCDRVTAWASRHGIRQFQQIGGPSVSVWRELRRLRHAVAVGAVEAARVHADAGDWCAFIGALGGIEAGRAGRVGLWQEITGEINQYDEMRGPQIVGVQAGAMGPFLPGGQIKTRTSTWRIEKKAGSQPGFDDSGVATAPFRSLSSLGPVTITVRSDSGVGSPLAWSNPNESSMYGPN